MGTRRGSVCALIALGAVLAALVAPAMPAGADANEAPSAPAAYRTLSSGPHTCVVRGDGSVVCWGYNLEGQLGLGDTDHRGDDPGELSALTAIDLGTGRTAVEVVAGNNHTCARLDDGSVKCWGFNQYGQLGLGDTVTRGDESGEMGDSLPAVPLGTGRTAVALSAGIAHTCALLDDATVKCWGYNGFGGLGQGHANDLGDQPGELGDALAPVALGAGRTAVAVSVGGLFTCALLDDATVKCWGYNGEGQLGLGDPDHRGDGPGELGDALATVALGSGRTALAVSSSRYHTCALLDDGAVKCWGFNTQGELGQGDTDHRGDGPGELGDALPAVALGTGRTVTAVAGGELHTCVLLDDASVKCWGYNDVGQLGQGDTNTRGDGPGEMGDSLAPVALGTGRTATMVTSGAHTACARLDDASLKCWGTSAQGQLGQGDTTDRGDGSGEMGDALPVVPVPAAPSGVSGTVSEMGSGTPVAGVWLAVLNTSDFSIEAGAEADGSGNYDVAVPPGSYFLYLLDPSGVHPAGFHGSPTVVAVASETVTDVDPVMSTTRGSITGTVTDAVSGDPIAGAWAVSLSTGLANTGATELMVTANGAGAYTLPGLRPATHFVGAVDPTGAHESRFFPSSPNIPASTPVSVTAGNATTANFPLPSQVAPGTGAALTGTVTEEGSGLPLSGIRVVALREADYAMVRGAATDGSGVYSLDVPAGGYKLAFLSSTGMHDGEWFDDLPSTELGSAVTATAPGVANAALVPSTGRMSGTITDDSSGDPVPGAWVVAIGPSGIAGGAVTAGDGTYTISGLPPGTYRATFADPNGGRVQEYHVDSPDYDGGTPFNVTAGATAAISAALALPPP